MTVGAVVDPDIASWPPLEDELRGLGRRLLDWAADGSGPRVCLVRGVAGSGKSRLLAWFLAGAAGHPRTVVHATVPAGGLTAETFAWELGRQLGHGPLSPPRLLERLRRDERPLLILVPDLHRAGAGPADLHAAQPASVVGELLGPLLSLRHVRAVVETGESGLLAGEGAEVVEVGGRSAEGSGEPGAGGLGGWSVEGSGEPGAGGLGGWSVEGSGEPGAGGPGGWSVEGSGEPGAGGPGDRSAEGSGEPGPGDRNAVGSDEPGPGDRSAESPGDRSAEGSGNPGAAPLDDPPPSYASRTPAYAELVAAVPRTPDGRPDWAGAAESVRREVLDAALLADDERGAVRELLTDPGFLVHGSATALTAVLADERIAVPGQLRRVWRRAAPELTAYRTDSTERAALLHAAAVGTDPALAEYLRPLAHRHTWTATWSRPDLPVSALAVPPGAERRVLVADVTGRLRLLDTETGEAVATETAAATVTGGAPGRPPAVRSDSAASATPPGSAEPSAAPDFASPSAALDSTSPAPAPDSAVPDSAVPDSVAPDSTSPALPPPPGFPPSPPRPVSLAPRDPHSALLLDESGALLSVVPEDPAYVNTAFLFSHIAAHHGSAGLDDEGAQVTAVAADPGSPYAVVGDRSGALHVWSLEEYQDTPRSQRVHERPVGAVACLGLGGDGPTLVFSAAPDGSVRLWETSAEPMPVPVERRGCLPTGLAAAATPEGPVLAVAWSDGALHLWHVLSGRMRAIPLLHPCRTLALTPEGLLLAGGPEGVYAVRLRLDRLWD
ncbi:AAA family ATPase [Streptomyces sp. NPDC047072]|uniref:AAA family ATPase n=1 Tax=Streptomyces sp. NPDC047072 TaxID=3154809 RepID=UPI0033F2B390